MPPTNKLPTDKSITDKQKIHLMRAEGFAIAARLADAQGEVRVAQGRLSNALAIYALDAREDDLALCRSRFADLADAIADEAQASIADARWQFDLNVATIDHDHAMEESHVQRSND